jgi:hypothetical protein
VFAVETNVVVPVKTAIIKEEYNAATFRRKVMEPVQEFAMIFPPWNSDRADQEMNSKIHSV